MKRVKRFIKSNIKLVVAFILGVIISGTGVYAAILYASSDVSYDNTSSGMSATNVQDALDELYTKANYRKITGDGVTNIGFQTNSANTIFANSNGLCIVRKGKLSCLKVDNYNVEKDHVQQVFSDLKCIVDSSSVYCDDVSYFYCVVYSSGDVYCHDNSDNSNCFVYSGGYVSCS